jgi:hypothetical protein
METLLETVKRRGFGMLNIIKIQSNVAVLKRIVEDGLPLKSCAFEKRSPK